MRRARQFGRLFSHDLHRPFLPNRLCIGIALIPDSLVTLEQHLVADHADHCGTVELGEQSLLARIIPGAVQLGHDDVAHPADSHVSSNARIGRDLAISDPFAARSQSLDDANGKQNHGKNQH